VDSEAQVSTKQEKLDRVFMNIANEVATLSHCERTKVGAVIVKNGNIVSFGYNGMPKGMENCCERKMYMSTDAGGWLDTETIEQQWPHKDENGWRYTLETKKEVLHAESNAILKAARFGQSLKGSTLYLTMSPCVDCAKLIIQSGIKRVLYNQEYRDISGIEFLSSFVKVEQIADVDI
jgi:dCMP deaminase